MSLYTDASLIVYPSGYKESKIYAQKPVNGTGDLTFSRASSATRLNEQGLIETASIIGSEEVLSTLINSNYDTFNEASLSGFHAIYSTSGTQRASTVDEINFVTGKTYQVNVDVSVVSGSIPFLRVREAVATNPTVFSGQLVSGNNLVTFTSTDTFTGLLEFASSSASEYRVSNVSVKEVTTSNIPRIDYSNGCGSLLLEPQRTNLITYSEDFSNAYWTVKDNVSITVNDAISPDGTQNADKLVEDSSSNQHRVYRSNVGTSKVFSFFAKAGGRSWVSVLSNNGAFSFFDIANGAIGTIQAGSTATITPYENGWYRCTLYNSHAINGSLIQLATANNITSYQGDGTSGIYIYGAQLEESSYPTSYIPSNSGSATTRIADTASKTGISSLIGQTEGVVFLDWVMTHESASTSEDYYPITISDGTASNMVTLNNYNNLLTVYVSSGGSSVFLNSSFSGSSGLRIKAAIAYKANDFAFYVNGVQIATDSSGSVPVSMSKINLGSYVNENKNDTIQANQTMLFKTRLTNTELAALTTI